MRTTILIFTLLISGIATAQEAVQLYPGFPAFLRQGDRLELRAGIHNNTKTELTGQAELQLTNAVSGESVDGWFQNVFPNQYITVAASGEETMRFPIEVPYLFYETLAWKLLVRLPDGADSTKGYKAAAGGTAPVLSNKILKTEKKVLPPLLDTATIALLLASSNNENLQHHSLTLSATTDPFLLLYPDLQRLANAQGHTNLQLAGQLFGTAMLMTARMQKAAQAHTTPAPPHSQTSPNYQLFSEAPKTLLSQLAQVQNKDGSFSWVGSGTPDTLVTIRILQLLTWINQMQVGTQETSGQLDKITASATSWLNGAMRAASAKQAFSHSWLAEALYTSTLLPQAGNAINKKWAQLTQGFALQKGVSEKDRAFVLLYLQHIGLPSHKDLYQQLATTKNGDAAALLLIYAAMNERGNEKEKLTAAVLNDGTDPALAAYALYKAFPASARPVSAATVQLGSQKTTLPQTSENYMALTIKGPFVKAGMGSIRLQPGAAHSWIMVRWNYFEPPEPVVNDALAITRTMQKMDTTTRKWQATEPGAMLHVGDTLLVTLALSSAGAKTILQDQWASAIEQTSNSLKSEHVSIFKPGLVQFYIAEESKKNTAFQYRLVVRHAGTFTSGGTQLMNASGSTIAALPAETILTE